MSNTHPDDDAMQEFCAGGADGAAAAHIRSCTKCIEKARSYGILFAALDEEVVAPPELPDAVMAAVRAIAATKPPLAAHRALRVAAAALAAACLLAAFSLLDPQSRLDFSPLEKPFAAEEIFQRAASASSTLFSMSADAFLPEIETPQAVETTLVAANRGILGAVESAGRAGRAALYPVRSSFAGPLLIIAFYLAANAVAFWRLRRRDNHATCFSGG